MGRTKSFDKAEALDKALQLFHSKGYEAVSMQDLVDTLGISRSSIYDTFEDKANLFLLALHTYRKRMADKSLNQLRDQPNSPKAIRNFFSQTLQEICDDPDRPGCFILNTMSDISRESIPTVSELLVDNKNEFIDVISQKIQQGQESGHINAKLIPVDAAHMIYWLYAGLVMGSRIEEEPERLQYALSVGLSILNP